MGGVGFAGRDLRSHGPSCCSHIAAVATASQPWVPPAVYAGVCGGACGHSGWRCGALVGLQLCEGCTNGVDIGVAVCGAADGLCGLDVVSFLLAWEEAVEELDTAASAVSVCTLETARRAPVVVGKMVGICVRSVLGLLVCRWDSSAGDICRRCLPAGSSGLLSVSARKVTRSAAEGSVRLWCRVPTDFLDPRGRCGVRGQCCQAALSRGALIALVGPGFGERSEWALLEIARGHLDGGSSVWALRVAGVCYLPRGPLGRRGPLALVPRGPVWAGFPPGKWVPDRPDVMSDQSLRMRRPALWCHRQCSRFKSSGV